MKFFRWYQFVVPVTLFPLSYLLWLRRYDGEHALEGEIAGGDAAALPGRALL